MNATAPTIGTATLGKDGKLTLNLRAQGPGMLGDALLTYAPDDPNYTQIVAHLGGIKPGETKLVPPWDD